MLRHVACFFGLLMLGFPTLSVAAISSEARIVSNRELAMSLLAKSADNAADAVGSVVCQDGITSCEAISGDAYQPGVYFYEETDATVHIEADIWSNADCPGVPDLTVAADLTLLAGQVIVWIEFTPPLPNGTAISMAWRIDGCDQTACLNHVIGQSPEVCSFVTALCNEATYTSIARSTDLDDTPVYTGSLAKYAYRTQAWRCGQQNAIDQGWVIPNSDPSLPNVNDQGSLDAVNGGFYRDDDGSGDLTDRYPTGYLYPDYANPGQFFADQTAAQARVVDTTKRDPLDLAADIPVFANPNQYDCENNVPANEFPNGDGPNDNTGAPMHGVVNRWGYVFIPGVQAANTGDLGGLVNGWADDVGTADWYESYAASGANSRNNFVYPISAIQRWRVFHFHNYPTRLNGRGIGGPGTRRNYTYNPGLVGIEARRNHVVGYVESYAHPTRQTTVAGDHQRVRVMGAWAGSANFRANPPPPWVSGGNPTTGVGTNLPVATYNADFAALMGDAQWRGFMNWLIWWTLKSYACNRPFFAHSGGGPVQFWLLRFIDELDRANAGTIKNWAVAKWRVYGMEEVLSEEARDLAEGLQVFNRAGKNLEIFNYIENTNNQQGSDTWRITIKGEMANTAVKQKGLEKDPFNMHITIKPSKTGHAYIGWEPEQRGNIMDYRFIGSTPLWFPAY